MGRTSANVRCAKTIDRIGYFIFACPSLSVRSPQFNLAFGGIFESSDHRRVSQSRTSDTKTDPRTDRESSLAPGLVFTDLTIGPEAPAHFKRLFA